MASKTFTDSLLTGALPPVAAGYARLIHRTTTWERIGDEHFQSLIGTGAPFICALWHSRLLLLPFTVPEMGRPLSAIVSAHRDGEAVARTLQRLGLGTARGSAADPRKPEKNKGGAAALRELVSLTKTGGNAAITPDGPRGPRQRAQPGIAQLARLTGLPVLPMAYATQSARYLDTWDRFLLPGPFGKGVFAFGEPVTVEGRGADAMEAGRVAIENALNRVTAQADAAMGHTPLPPTEPLEVTA